MWIVVAVYVWNTPLTEELTLYRGRFWTHFRISLGQFEDNFHLVCQTMLGAEIMSSSAIFFDVIGSFICSQRESLEN